MFTSGCTVVRRCVHVDGRIATVQSARVVRDTSDGLLLWVGHGSSTMQQVDLDGRPTRHLPYAEEFRTATVLQCTPWTGRGVLIWSPAGAAHSVWWWFEEYGFSGWYINLEAPTHRWAGGIDTLDHALDVVVDADRRWQWKDGNEFAELTGSPGFWDTQEAAQIRAEGRLVVARVEAAAFPFDGSWCDFVPDPEWAPSALPHWWDQPTEMARRYVWPAGFYRLFAVRGERSRWVGVHAALLTALRSRIRAL